MAWMFLFCLLVGVRICLLAWKNAKKEISVEVFPNDSLNNLLFIPSVSKDVFVEHLLKYNEEMWTSQAVL